MRQQKSRWDTRIIEGNIVVQNPVAGAKVKSGRTVYVVPSKGARIFAVPNVVGKRLRQAHLFIQQAGLTVAEVIEEPSAEVEEGAVSRQYPVAGSEVGASAGIKMYVSDGLPGELLIMANVVGKPVSFARNLITEAGFRVGKVSYEFTTSYERNVVIRQVPEAGEELRQGARVSLVISKL